VNWVAHQKAPQKKIPSQKMGYKELIAEADKDLK
jgi:hypothetical protein